MRKLGNFGDRGRGGGHLRTSCPQLFGYNNIKMMKAKWDGKDSGKVFNFEFNILNEADNIINYINRRSLKRARIASIVNGRLRERAGGGFPPFLLRPGRSFGGTWHRSSPETYFLTLPVISIRNRGNIRFLLWRNRWNGSERDAFAGDEQLPSQFKIKHTHSDCGLPAAAAAAASFLIFRLFIYCSPLDFYCCGNIFYIWKLNWDAFLRAINPVFASAFLLATSQFPVLDFEHVLN